MGLSAFNAMRARLAKQQAEEVRSENKTSDSTIKVTEVKATENEKVEESAEPTEEVKAESKPKKKTDAEKLKKE